MPRVKPRKLLTNVVRDRLRERLLSGTYAPGGKIPPEDELTREFEVSRVTLREAVRGLVEEGYLSRQHGLGTYVTSRPKLRNNLDVNFGVTHLIESLGMKPGNRETKISEEAPPRRFAGALGLEPDEPVIVLERIRTANDQPIVYSIEYVLRHILPKPAEHLENLSGSLYHLLASLGHPVDHGVATIKPMIADTKMAQKLQVELDALLLYLEQVDYGADERPLLLSREWYRTDELEFTVYRKGPS
ncbi:MAG: GntR family transcriptional regulator [Acidobacteria bacterium]|nr:GntR family transcriptional regulator [Acidobacteriota bacterium]